MFHVNASEQIDMFFIKNVPYIMGDGHSYLVG